MYVFLLFLGAVTTAAGLALVTSVATGAFEAESVTPGMIAAVGGLLLIGLGLTVRVLQRIERALEMRPMPRPMRTTAPTAAAAPDRTDGPAPVTFFARPRPDAPPRAALPAASSAPMTAEDAAVERLREKIPTSARPEHASAGEGADMLLPPVAAASRGNGSATANGAAVARTNGAGSGKASPPNARSSAPAARPKGSMFDAFWPKATRPRTDGEEARAPDPAPPPAAAFTQEHEAAAAEAGPGIDTAAAPVSVLKSGVVEGMAYTLYSDGSIEAQLPQGMMRFGSIAELRHHIESGS